jgi:hypothetical protein
MKSRDRKLRHNRKYVLRIPALFSYHSSSTKCTIAYDVSSMATGCDVSESDVTGSDVTGINVIRPKVGDYLWGVILIVRSVVWYSNGVFYHVRIFTVVSLLNNLRAADRGLCAIHRRRLR